jgi:uncharacterized paraquat-inducible protein A
MAELSHPSPDTLCGCHCCGLVQTLPVKLPRDRTAVCSRCHTPLRHLHSLRNRWTAALAVSALIFYGPAMLLPMLRIEQFGHMHEDSLLSGVTALWAGGYWFIGTIVLIFSVLLPPLKLMALWILSSTTMVSRHHHRAIIYRLVEVLGRWGMLDVMLVALLVAYVKLGDLVSIHAGSGALAFTSLVLLSLLASLTFNPQLMWQETE